MRTANDQSHWQRAKEPAEKVFFRRTALLLGLLCLSGCAGYQVGTQSLFRNDIRTVHVPIVRSDSFRPELGVRLTEAIQKRLEARSQYKIVSDANADSVLTCRLTTDSKRVVTETKTDEPRQLKTFMTVEATWLDRRGNVLMENRFLPPGETAFYFAQGADFVPEAGQSMATSQQRAIERLADHIIDQMEARW
ncbi:MAG: LPS assembly lipoprotein LptE [Pirellulales bacterium]